MALVGIVLLVSHRLFVVSGDVQRREQSCSCMEALLILGRHIQRGRAADIQDIPSWLKTNMCLLIPPQYHSTGARS